MSLHNKEISIIRINNENYLEFSKVLEWRRTGEEQRDFEGYKGKKMSNFFREHNVLNSKQFYIYAAKLEGKVIGYINGIVIPKFDPRIGIMYVDELWTAPPYRKMGIAEKLMKEIINKAKEMELWRLRLYVSKDNPPARNFYKKMGYIEKDESLFCEIDL